MKKENFGLKIQKLVLETYENSKLKESMKFLTNQSN